MANELFGVGVFSMHLCILRMDRVIILDKNLVASQSSWLEKLSNFHLVDQLVGWKQEDRPKVYLKLQNTTSLKVWGKQSTTMYLHIRDV